MNKAVAGHLSEAEARELLLNAGIEGLKRKGGYTPSLTTLMPENVWQPPIPVTEWFEDFPSYAEIDAYREGLTHKVRYQTSFHLWYIDDGMIMKTKGLIHFLRPDNHEMIELSNLEAVTAYLAYKKARIWYPPKRD